MPIKDLPDYLKPREKAMLNGLSSLTDIELLALILRTGTGKIDAIDLAKKLIENFGNLNSLLNASIEELTKIKGIGKVKALEIMSIRQFLNRTNNNEIILNNPMSIVDFACSKISDHSKEYKLG